MKTSHAESFWSGAPSQIFDDWAQKRIKAFGQLAPGAHVHIIGICGTGTGAVLQLLVAQGFRVTGSDKAFYPPMGDIVREYADEVFEGYSTASFARRPDCVLIGNAVSQDNPEVAYVLEEQIPFCSMPEALSARLIGTSEYCPCSIVIAGTHGKTTTTALSTWLFEAAAREPAYFIGGVAGNFKETIRGQNDNVAVATRVCVLEGDEYDSAFFAKYSKFHAYRPDILVITSLEFDHGDIFSSIDDIEQEFERLARAMPRTGLILLADSYPRLVSLAKRWKTHGYSGGQVYLYGESRDAKFRLLERTALPDHAQSLRLTCAGETFSITVPLSGAHNAYNALVACIVGLRSGLTKDEIASAMPKFLGVKRRQEVIYDKNQVRVIEDFAHHPTAVATTLAGIREAYTPKRMLVAFDPRSNTSRRDFFQSEYAAAFDDADFVFLKNTVVEGSYSATADVRGLDCTRLVADITSRGPKALLCEDAASIADELVAHATPGDLIVLMSNGSFEGLPAELPQRLAAKA